MFKKLKDGVDDVSISVELLVRVGENREVSADKIAAFCACVVRSAKLSCLVSWSLRRSTRIDSGVGAEGGRGSVRFWRLVSGRKGKVAMYTACNKIGEADKQAKV